MIENKQTIEYFNDVKNIINKNGFKNITDVNNDLNIVFKTTKKSIILHCINFPEAQSLYITVYDTKQIFTHKDYKKIQNHIKKVNHYILVQPYGNIDTINILNNPTQYNLKSLEEAFSILHKNNNTVGITIILQNNAKKYYIDIVKFIMSIF